MNKRYIGIFGVLVVVLIVIATILLTPAAPLAAQDQATIAGPPVTQALTTATDTTTPIATFGVLLVFFGLLGIGLAVAHRQGQAAAQAGHGQVGTDLGKHDVDTFGTTRHLHGGQTGIDAARAAAVHESGITRPLVAHADTHIPTAHHGDPYATGHLTTPVGIPPTDPGRPTYMGPSQI